MSIVTKLVSMIALGQTAAESRVAVQHFLTSLASALVLALLSGMMIGALLFGAHYVIYVALLTYTSLLPMQALGITFGIGIIITAGLIVGTIQQLKNLFDLPKQLQVSHYEYEQPLTSRVMGIAEAFFEGLTGRSRSRF